MLKIKKNTKLAPYTTFRIGGPAKFFVEVENSDGLIEAVSWVKQKKVKYFILGGGSNILFSDKGYGGLVIRIKNEELRMKNKIINVDAGVMLSKLLKVSLDNNLTGLEWTAGIQGTVGGAIVGNAGSRDGCIADIVESVEVFDGEKVKVLKNKDLKFGYRTSVFKITNLKATRRRVAFKLVILSATLKLKKGDKKTAQEIIKKYLKQRQDRQPKGFSGGSIFKNPKGKFAGKLIELCGLKGFKIGDAQISEKHTNFIINKGNAKAADVVALIKRAKKEVYAKFGVKLEEEIRIVK